MSSLDGTKRSDINWEEIPIKDNKILLNYYSFIKNTIVGEMGVDEFLCPAFQQDSPRARTTTQNCELKGRGSGCSDIKFCIRYCEQKRLQKNYPLVDWENPNPHDPVVKEIVMIKKGLIIPVSVATDDN